MHVLFIPKWYPGRHDPQLGDFLRKQALAVASRVHLSVLHVEAVNTGDTSDELTTADGSWELRIRYRPNTSWIGLWRRSINLVRYWSACGRGWARIVKERGAPDLIHSYILVRPVLFAWWMARKHRIPYLISEQSSEYLDGTWEAKGPLFKALNHFLFRRAAAVTTVSAWLGDALVRLRLCARYTVVPNVVPGLDRYLPPAGSPGHFLVVADLVDKTKNVSGVIRALAQARRTDPRLRLTIIGDGPDRGALEQLAAELGMGPHVEFRGRVANTVVLDAMAGVFAVIVNSNVETFSVVTGEALAQGKPVIATRCGGPVAFMTPENGILIEPRDTHGLCEAMLHLTASASDYDPERIRRSVGERFSEAAVGATFLATYQTVLDAQ